MKTSCFKYYKGDNGISIALYAPKSWKGDHFPALAPSRQLLTDIKSGAIDHYEYEERYRKEVLSKLDPLQIYNDLRGKVLLCWENPVFDKNGNIFNKNEGFCHRHIISKWIWEKLNIKIEEWKTEKSKIKTISLF